MDTTSSSARSSAAQSPVGEWLTRPTSVRRKLPYHEKHMPGIRKRIGAHHRRGYLMTATYQPIDD